MPGRFVRLLRCVLMPVMIKRWGSGGLDWIYHYHIDWDQKVELMDRAA
jgi:hypothetical protein